MRVERGGAEMGWRVEARGTLHRRRHGHGIVGSRRRATKDKRVPDAGQSDYRRKWPEGVRGF